MNELTERQRERIVERLRRGESLRAIQDATGHRRETVARYGRIAGVIPGAPPAVVPHRLGSVCDRFREEIEQAVRDDVPLRELHRRLRDDGFEGSYSAVKRYVRRLRLAPNRGGDVVALAGRPALRRAA